MPRALAIALPDDVRVATRYPGAFFADAFSVPLPPGGSADVRELAERAVGAPSPWVDRLMALRDALVTPFGLKTVKALRNRRDPDAPPRIGLFRIYEQHADELVLGEDDRHLDFRLSVRCHAGHLVAVTVVHCHNLLGRSYIRLVAPFHRAIMRSSLERAVGR